MKNLFLLAFVFTTIFGFSQSSMEEVDYYQSIFGMGKKQVVAELITLDPETKDAFWMLYDEYEVNRKELGKKRIALLETYAEKYNNMAPEELKKVMMESMSLNAEGEKLIKSYYKKIEKQVGGVAAAQFYHMEVYLMSEIRVAVFGNIPMVDKIRKE